MLFCFHKLLSKMFAFRERYEFLLFRIILEKLDRTHPDLSIYLSVYLYIYSLRKSNNHSLKSAQYKSVIILWEEDDAK